MGIQGPLHEILDIQKYHVVFVQMGFERGIFADDHFLEKAFGVEILAVVSSCHVGGPSLAEAAWTADAYVFVRSS
jgi:hypothetical protein